MNIHRFPTSIGNVRRWLYVREYFVMMVRERKNSASIRREKIIFDRVYHGPVINGGRSKILNQQRGVEMAMQNTNSSVNPFDTDGVYEGSAPYLFISYSHKNRSQLQQVRSMLQKRGIRFWYDRGLSSGVDFSQEIASHLEHAACCLLLLSPEAVESDFVKDEIHFAKNHRIPIHPLKLEEFKEPIEIELWLGRIQMVMLGPGYEQELLRSLPPEVFEDRDPASGTGDGEEGSSADQFGAPPSAFEVSRELMYRQGTRCYEGTHRELEYPVMILEDHLQEFHLEEARTMARTAARQRHPVFSNILDVRYDGGRMWMYQEHRGEVSLDQYLKSHTLTEEQVLACVTDVLDALEYLFRRDLGFQDLARGSMVMREDGTIGIWRLAHPYYGLIRLRKEMKPYYLEKEIQEIAVLLYQLCTGTVPVLPFPILEDAKRSRTFLNKINLILQKCAKENGRMQYDRFSQIRDDLERKNIPMSDRWFLKKRAQKLAEYERAKTEYRFARESSDDDLPVLNGNLEEQFGLDPTVILPLHEGEGQASIRVRICSTGQVVEFAKQEIVIGRADRCDMILAQPMLSRFHARVSKEADGGYLVCDLESANGTSVSVDGRRTRLVPNVKTWVPEGGTIWLFEIELQLL